MLTRREVILGSAGALTLRGQATPRVDYHAHPESGMTVERALAISKERNVKLGLVQHAGAPDPASPDRLTTDDALLAWRRELAGKPVYCGIQAERMNWMTVFSKSAVAQLDYVLGDALTMPAKSGAPVKLWMDGFLCDDAQNFMDRYVDYHVEVMAKQPLDILANPTFLPALLQPRFDTLWTEARMRKVVEAAVRYGYAIEINSKYRVPRLPFLRMAKAAGLRFSFGSNAHDAQGIGNVAYGIEMYGKLGLTPDRFFRPAPPGKKPIQIRTLA